MKKQLQMILDFHNAYEINYPKAPTKTLNQDTINLLFRLIDEELAELRQAVAEEPLENVANELTDLQYVLFDMVVGLGMQDKFEEMFAEVHRSNMSKLGEDGKPIRREDGKILKGPNYSKADLAKVLSS